MKLNFKIGLAFLLGAKMLYIHSKYVAMTNKEKSTSRTKTFNPEQSIRRARLNRENNLRWKIKVEGSNYVWKTRMERVGIIRKGLPYESIEVIARRIDMPVKQMLQLLDIPQTTYNKKKRDKELLSGRDSEVILALTELLDFGQEVFNAEFQKFQRWLRKPNIALGGVSPESLFDSLTGIQEVRNSLNRLEYGNLA